MPESSKHECECGAKATCYIYPDTSKSQRHFVFICENSSNELEIPLFCPFCGLPLDGHTHKPKSEKKRSFVPPFVAKLFGGQSGKV